MTASPISLPADDTRESAPPPVRAAEELARGVLAGDAGATRALVTLLGPPMVRAVRGVIGARHPDVEDVLQEAVFATLRALRDFRGECTLIHFACRIAVLTAMAARRRSNVRERWHCDVESPESIEGSDADSPTKMVLATRRREILRTLCDELPEAQAEALMLHCALGYTVDEIAESTGARLDTVRSRLRLGKQSLRKLVEADPILLEALEVER